MTTKKQRRAAVAEKNAKRKAAEDAVNLELLRVSQEKQERLAYDADRAERSKKAAKSMRNKLSYNEAVDILEPQRFAFDRG